MKTPVLFLVFNRPDTAQRVFDEIRKARPPFLFVAADGPRANHADDAINCRATRNILRQIDWDCEVKTLFRDENLGCRRAVSSAIDWFFENVEEGIILEDDCLPHTDFFSFCEILLARYRHEASVMHISGGNFQFGRKRGLDSYYFSRISHIWGWASWRRAWEKYDVNMTDFPEFKSAHRSFFISPSLERYWLFHFNRMYKGADTWDYQWTYAVMKNGGYCIIPNVNLISNIGFGAAATHSFNQMDSVAAMATAPLGELRYPAQLQFNDEADRFTVEVAFPIPPLHQRALAKLKKIVTRFFA